MVLNQIVYLNKKYENAAYWEISETKKWKIDRHPSPCPSSVVHLPTGKNNMQFSKTSTTFDQELA